MNPIHTWRVQVDAHDFKTNMAANLECFIESTDMEGAMNSFRSFVAAGYTFEFIKIERIPPEATPNG